MRKTAFFFMTCIFLTSVAISESTVDDSIFPTPEIIKGNVAFWKKIYTEVSLKEGLLHDREYPMVIYNKLTGNYKSSTVKNRREQISTSLKIITSQPRSSWSKAETEIYDLFITHADSSAIEGAAERVRFQQGQKERFREGLERSGMFLDTIRAILKHYGVPLRLAYLPHVESSFNTEAYSKVGAAGLWQFMRGTGKLYGMKIDYLIDERRDPIISTVAAAKYLSSSYQELKSWPLAITSYNHGVYGMKRAVAQTGSRDIGVIIQKYSSRSFKFASSNFYGCFLAASEIADNYKTYFPSVVLMPPIRYTDLTLTHYIHPDVLCNALNISRTVFSDLNPAIRPAVFDAHKRLPKGFVIHLPGEFNYQTAFNSLQAIPDSLKSAEPERPQYYKVNKGDNLYAIASRLGVSIQELAFENNITKYNMIRAGQVLRVPGKAGTTIKPAEPAVAAVTPKTSDAPKAEATRQEPKTVPTSSVANEAVVEIASAEAQSAIPPEEAPPAEKMELSVVIPKETQAATDNVSKVKHVPIQKPVKEPIEEISDSLRDIALAPAIVEPPVTTTRKPSLTSNFDVSIYNLDVTMSSVGTSAELLVSIDETIGHYADWLGIPTSRIRKLNDMGHTSDIRINKRLLIPIDRDDALEQFVAARLEYHMAIEEDFYTQFTVSDVKAHTLKKGQTLWDLCNEGESTIPLWLLKKQNQQIDFSRLLPGMTIWIPVIEERTESEEVVSEQKPSTSPDLNPARRTVQTIKRVP